MADNNRMSIGIGVRIDDINKVKNNLQSELNKIKGLSAKIETVNLDVAKVQSNIQTQLSKMNFKINIGNTDTKGLDNVINKTKQATQEAQQYKNVMGKSLNIGDGAKAFDDLQRRANEIRKTVDSLAKISFNTGKNGSINNATLTYTDNMGKLVTETMGWKQVTTDAGKTVQNIFTTLNTKVSDNVQQMNRLEAKFESIKSKMQGKLSTASAIGIDPTLINQLQTQLNSLNAKTPISQINQLQQQINALGNNSTANINKLQNSINSLTNRINNMKASNANIIDKNNITELRTAENEVVKLKDLLSQVKSGKIIDGKLISSEINTARNSVNQLSTAINGVKANASTLGSMFKNIFSYAVGGSFIYAGIRGLRESLTDIKNVDDAMRDLKRVADDVSNTTLNNFSNEANNMAKSLGNSTESVIQAVTTFKQLGYSWEQAKDYMAKESIILSNVGDMSAKDSSDAIVATLKGFKLEAQDTTRVVDSLNEAGNKFAIRTGELAEGLRVSSAALAIANNDLYQSEALITAGTEVLRDSNEVGTGLKTISMRLDQVKSKGGETFFKLKNDLKELADTDLTKADGSLRSTYDIILDLSKAWNSGKLDDMTKAKLLDETAGKQQSKVMASILQNASQLPKIYDTLKNSAGSAEKEQARYMDSISGKLNAFTESIKAISLNLSNSSVIKNLLSGATSGVNGLNSIIKTFGAMPTVIMGVVGAMTIFNAKFRENVQITAGSVIPGYTKLTNSLNGLKANLSASYSTQVRNIEASKAFALASQEAGMSTSGMGMQLLGMQAKLVGTRALMIACTVATVALQTALSMGLGLALSFGISKIMEMANAQENLKQSNDEYIQSLQQKNPQDNQKLLDDYKKLQSELSNLKQGTKEYSDKEQELANAQGKLIELYPQSSSEIDKNTGKKKLNADATQKLIDKENEYAQAKATQVLRDNKVNNTNDIKKLADGYAKATEEMNKYQEMYNNGERYIDGEDGRTIDIAGAIKKNQTASEQYATQLQAVKNALGLVEDKSGSYSGAIDIINKALGTNTDKTNENTKAKEQNAGTGGDYSEEEEAEQKKAKAIQEATDSYNNSTKAIAQAQQYLDKLNKSHAVTPTLVKQMEKSYGDLGNSLNSVSTAQEYLNDKIKQQQATQAEAYEIMMGDDQNFYQQKIANNEEFKGAYENLLNAFQTDGEQAYTVDFNNYKTLNELKQGTQQDLGIAVENWLESMVGESAKNYGIDFSNFKSFAQAKVAILQKLQNQISIVTQQLNDAIDKGNEESENYQYSDPADRTHKTANANYTADMRRALEKLNTAYQKVSLSFDEFNGKMQGASLGGISDFSGTGGGSDKSAEKTEKLADEIAKLKAELDIDKFASYNNAIKEVDNALTENTTLRGQYTEGSTEYRMSQQKEIELYDKKRQKILELNMAQVEDAKLRREKLAQYSFQFNADGKLINGQQRLLELQESINAETGNTEEAKQAKQDDINWLKDIQKLTQEYNTLTEDTIPKTTNDYNELANSIKKVKDEMKKANEEALGSFRDKIAGDILGDLKKKATDTEEALDKAEEKAKQAEEDAKSAKEKEWEEKIKAVQAELDLLNDETTNNEDKLKKLKAERALWAKETGNVFAKSKIDELDKSISETEKTIKKDNLQKQLEELNKQKDADLASYDDKIKNLEDFYTKKKEDTKKANDDDLLEKKAYAKADELITKNNQSEILKILQSHAQNYKDVGSLLGKNFNEAFQEEINKAKTALDALKNDIAGSTSISGSSSSSSSSTKYKDSLSTGVTYQDSGSGAINVERPLSKEEEDELYKKIARYDTGGTVPSNIGSNGGIAIVDPEEKILNKDDSEILKGVYNYFKEMSMRGLTTQIQMQYPLLSTQYTTPALNTNLDSIASSITTNNNNTDNSNYAPVNFNVNIVNEKGAEALTEQKLEKMITKVTQKQMTKYGGKSF